MQFEYGTLGNSVDDEDTFCDDMSSSLLDDTDDRKTQSSAARVREGAGGGGDVGRGDSLMRAMADTTSSVDTTVSAGIGVGGYEWGPAGKFGGKDASSF